MKDMTNGRAKALIETYGSDPARWPDGERQRAEDLIASSPELQAHLSVHATLDRVLDTSENPSLTQDLRDRIVATGLTVAAQTRAVQNVRLKAVPADPWQRAKDFFRTAVSGFFSDGGLRPVGIYAGAALLGLVIGLAVPASNMSGNGTLSDDDIFEVAFASTDYLSPDGGTFRWDE